MDVAKIIEDGRALIAAMHGVIDHGVVGSALYRPDAKDVDFVLLIEGSHAGNRAAEMLADGWESCGSLEYGDWTAVRRGDLNFILCADRDFFVGYLRASQVCKALGLERRTDRVLVHQIVRDGLSADEALRRVPAEPQDQFA